MKRITRSLAAAVIAAAGFVLSAQTAHAQQQTDMVACCDGINVCCCGGFCIVIGDKAYCS